MNKHLLFQSLRQATQDDIPALRKLVNQAYQELADLGLNYTAVDQDEEKTRERLNKGRAFVLTAENNLIATVLLSAENHFTEKNTAYVSQFAVAPKFKKSGLGSLLMDHCESLAQLEKFEGVQLDTAKPAKHLVNWYLKRGYQIVGEKHWDGKTYDSFIFEKLF
jgi:ribosomal protein S18 acetylase RimI-like enzyme